MFSFIGKFSKKKVKIFLLRLEIPIIQQSSKTLFNIGENSIKSIMNSIDEITYHNSKNYAGILLRINSPGGSGALSEEMAEGIIKLRDKTKIPVVCSIGDTACSGAYMVACASDYIFANKLSWTGSIGVIMNLPNFSGISEKLGITQVTIKSGKMKDIGNPFRDMTKEEKEYLEMLLNKAHDEFKSFVCIRRPVSVKHMEEIADGRVIDAFTAKEYKLIDAIGTQDDALNYLLELLNTDREHAQIIDNSQSEGLLGKLTKSFNIDINFSTDILKLR